MDYADGGLADGYSTALFVMGLDEGLDFCAAHGLSAVFITDDKTVYVTDALRDAFTLTGEEAGFALAD